MGFSLRNLAIFIMQIGISWADKLNNLKSCTFLIKFESEFANTPSLCLLIDRQSYHIIFELQIYRGLSFLLFSYYHF